MKKVNLASVLEVLLKEGQDQAGAELHKYFIERCAEINSELTEDEDDAVDVDVTPEDPDVAITSDDGDETASSGSKAVLEVYYPDPDGDCEFDDDIMNTIGVSDMDGAGWAKGIRSLEFVFDDEASANAASDALENRDGGPDNLQTDVTIVDLDAPSEEEDDDDGVDDSGIDDSAGLEEDDGGDESTETTPDAGEFSPISGQEEMSEDGEDDSDDAGDEIFKDPEESDSDKIQDLADEVAKLKAELESFQDLDESFEYEPVKVKMANDTEIGTGGKISSNDESLIPGNKDMENRIAGEPIEIEDKPHQGFERQQAPAFKTVDVGARNIRNGVMDGTSKVSKEGDSGALLNDKGDGFGSDSPGSIIDGK